MPRNQIQNAIPPTIIIGMHRSGTSMIAGFLEKMGMFMGVNQDHNREARFFMDLNDRMLKTCGASWRNPAPIQSLLDNHNARKLVLDYCRYLITHLPVWRYTGLRRFSQGEVPFKAKGPWGWKDPRNTFTLPIWLEIFPQSRVLHIYRNGVDVAASLSNRAYQAFSRTSQKHSWRKRLHVYSLLPGRDVYLGSPDMMDLTRGYTLWEKYIERSFGYDAMELENLLHIRYEDVVASPREQLPLIANFCGLSPTEGLIENLAGQVRATRKFAYRSNTKLLEFYQSVKDRTWMQKLNYRREE